jgi:hypothetical protein
VRDGGEELVVFDGVAYGDADGVGKTHPGERANDDAFMQEIVGEGFGGRADPDEEEIGFAGNGVEAKATEFIVEALAFGAIHFGGTLDMFAIFESSECGGLADTSDVEGSAELVHFGDESGMADAVADAEPRKAIDFGKGAQREDVVVLLEQFEGIWEIGTLGIFLVRFVENNQNIARNFFEEGVEFGSAEGRTGGIVGIGNIDNARLRGDGASDGAEIEREVAHGRLNEFAAAGANGDGKESEGTFTGDAFEAGAKKNARSQVDDFAGAEADEDFLGTDGETRGEDFTKTLAAAVGIPVGFTESMARGIHGFGGRAERIFVGSELDGVDLEVLLNFLNGLAGNVGGKTLDVVRDEFFESVGHGRRRFRGAGKLMERISLHLLCTIQMKIEVTGGESVPEQHGCANKFSVAEGAGTSYRR